MGWERIFYNETNFVLIDLEKSHQVNEEFSLFINVFQITASVLILLLAVAALFKFYNVDVTFVNVLVILDCLISVGHIPVLLMNLEYVLNI